MFEQKNPLNPVIVAVPGMTFDAELVQDPTPYTYNPVKNPIAIASNNFLMAVPASNRYFCAKTL
jgi:hypothetical protein